MLQELAPTKIGSDYLVMLEDVKDASDDSALTGISPTFSVYDDRDDAAIVEDQAMPVSPDYSNHYYGVFPDTETTALSGGQRLRYEVQVNGGSDLQRVFRGLSTAEL